MTLRSSADVCIVGGGIIGRCAALALADRGVRVDIVSVPRAGASSRAAAGLLAPSIEGASGAAQEFAVAAREAYPAFLQQLASDTRIAIEFSRRGILDVALSEDEAARLREFAGERGHEWLAPNAVRGVEPALGPTRGAVLVEHDGYVDNVALMDALERATRARHPRIREIGGLVTQLALRASAATLLVDSSERIAGACVVLAAGAWSAQIRGAPLAAAVRPLQGQMLRYEAAAHIQRAMYGAGVYLVPRGRAVLAGATSDDVGFELGITDAARALLDAGAKALLPGLRDAQPVDQWAGLRPMTGDALPLLGSDPEYPSLIYACGHSRNGILKAPLTGNSVAALFLGEVPPVTLAAFDPARLQPAKAVSPEE